MKRQDVILGVVLSALIFSLGVAYALESASMVNIDGKFDEWKEMAPLAQDSVGEVSEAEIIDFVKLWVVEDGQNLYFSYTCAHPMDWNIDAWRYNIFIDVDDNPITGYRGWQNDWAIGADYLIQGATVFKFIGTGPMAWDWQKIDIQEYALKGSQVEIQVRRDLIDLKKGQKAKILLHGDNVNEIDFFPDEYTKKALELN